VSNGTPAGTSGNVARLDPGGDFDQLAGGGFRVGKGAFCRELQSLAAADSVWPCTISCSDPSRSLLRYFSKEFGENGCDGGASSVSRRLFWVCAVTRRRFPVGASPTRQTLQPEATGAVMEVTKWLKPSISVSRIGDSASVQAVTRVERRASL
jgi:hypothetical protein